MFIEGLQYTLRLWSKSIFLLVNIANIFFHESAKQERRTVIEGNSHTGWSTKGFQKEEYLNNHENIW